MRHFLYLTLLVLICFASSLALVSCKDNNTPEAEAPSKSIDTMHPTKTALPEVATPKQYSNARFREVTVEQLNTNQFRVKGEAQIFEASFSWVVEDGHNELAKGYEMTDAGAPEWGHFDFTIEVAKKDENSTLTLILFEASAKDGSRQHELPIVL